MRAEGRLTKARFIAGDTLRRVFRSFMRMRCPYPSPDAFIFEDRREASRIRTATGGRVLYKLACDFGLEKPVFQMIWRPIATLAQRRAARGEALARDDDNQCLNTGDYSEREDDRRRDAIRSLTPNDTWLARRIFANC
jgi:hypothetical protein